jgi:periplasmic protein TonB
MALVDKSIVSRSTLAIVAMVAILHLLALHPIELMHDDSPDEDEIEVVIELAPNRPIDRMTDASERTAAPTPVVHPTPAQQKKQQTKASKASTTAAVAEAAVPATNATYEVGSSKNPRPPYPPAAFLGHIEGRVLIKAHVMADGKLVEVQLLQTSGSTQLDQSAIETIARWEVQPARKNGQPVDQWIEIPINFRIIQK